MLLLPTVVERASMLRIGVRAECMSPYFARDTVRISPEIQFVFRTKYVAYLVRNTHTGCMHVHSTAVCSAIVRYSPICWYLSHVLYRRGFGFEQVGGIENQPLMARTAFFYQLYDQVLVPWDGHFVEYKHQAVGSHPVDGDNVVSDPQWG